MQKRRVDEAVRNRITCVERAEKIGPQEHQGQAPVGLIHPRDRSDEAHAIPHRIADQIHTDSIDTRLNRPRRPHDRLDMVGEKKLHPGLGHRSRDRIGVRLRRAAGRKTGAADPKARGHGDRPDPGPQPESIRRSHSHRAEAFVRRAAGRVPLALATGIFVLPSFAT